MVRSKRYGCTYTCATDASADARPNTSTDAKPTRTNLCTDTCADTCTNNCADASADACTHASADASADESADAGTHACANACTYAGTHACADAGTYASAHTCTNTCADACTDACAHAGADASADADSYVCADADAHSSTHASAHACAHTCSYVGSNASAHAGAHTCTNTCADASAHSGTHSGPVCRAPRPGRRPRGVVRNVRPLGLLWGCCVLRRRVSSAVWAVRHLRGVDHELPRAGVATQVLAGGGHCRVGGRPSQKRRTTLPGQRPRRCCAHARTRAESCSRGGAPRAVLLRRLRGLLPLELLRGPGHLPGAAVAGRLRRQRHGGREALVVRILAASECSAVARASRGQAPWPPPTLVESPWSLCRPHPLAALFFEKVTLALSKWGGFAPQLPKVRRRCTFVLLGSRSAACSRVHPPSPFLPLPSFTSHGPS